MYNAFAEFDSQSAAQKACDAVLSSTNGIVRIGSRMVVPPRAQGLHNHNTAAALQETVSHGGAMTGEWVVPNEVAMNAARIEARYDQHAGYEPPRACKYILCAQGSKESVEHAAKIMRDAGGCNVDVRNARGSFLDGQPPIK